jgi:hypothetical protein
MLEDAKSIRLRAFIADDDESHHRS